MIIIIFDWKRRRVL